MDYLITFFFALLVFAVVFFIIKHFKNKKDRIPEYVIAPEGCHKYLTPGETYKVSNFRVTFTGAKVFESESDQSGYLFCCLKNCTHLRGQDWIVKK